MVRKYTLEIVAFITGFSLLAYELAAARILAPSIGSSTYVWTSVIGVIIAALSLGFFVGGRLADKRGRATDIAWLLLLACILCTGTLVMYEGVLESIVQMDVDNRVRAVYAALMLFAPASFVIGTISPYLAKLNVNSLKSTGRAVASLDMFNSIGGIVGTFVTGFILFGYIGSQETIGLVAVLLLAASWLMGSRKYIWHRAVVSSLVVLVVVAPMPVTAGLVEIDTPSAHYKVVSGLYENRMITGLLTGPGGTQSAVYQSGLSDPVFWYTQEMARQTIQRKPSSILMLGGGAFTLPQHLAEKLPNASIDAVEIDPELKGISEKYFNYRNPTNVTPIFEDARTYVNRSTKTYDVILVDVYGDTSIPFSLITKEYARAVASRLNEKGVVIVNLIAGTKGPCQEVFSAANAAYRSYLPVGRYVSQPGGSDERVNNIVIYSKQPISSAGYSPIKVPTIEPYTDNYAPAERLYYACQQVQA